MINYYINGGKKLKGEVEVHASKNSSVSVLIAALLNEGKTTINNLAKIEEVNRIIEVLRSIGVKCEWKGAACEIDPNLDKLNLSKINVEAAIKTRSIILMIGALAARLKKFYLPYSGGCKLGKRTIMPHVYALENFGVKVKSLKGKYEVTCSKLKAGGNIVMYESGDTATENAIMAAALAPGKTVIKFASANYMVQDLCCFLQKLGVKINGIGTTTVTIHGKRRELQNPVFGTLSEPDRGERGESVAADIAEGGKNRCFASSGNCVSYDLIEDPIEAMLFISVACVTKSSLVIKRCPIEFLELELFKLKKMGFRFKILKEYLAKNGLNKLADIQTFPSKLVAPAEKLYGRPFPGLNIDNLPFFVPIATQAKGETLIHDWVYENRAIYYIELNRLGADIKLADPHRVYVKGPTELTGAEVICPPALRPSAIILVAMLEAKGKSVLRNVYAVERGYGDLVDRLRGLGAEIERKVTES